MEWWGAANQLEFIDKPDALTIRATSIRRLGDLIWPAGCALAALATLFSGASTSWPPSFAGIAALLVAGWFSTSVIELRVTQWNLATRTIRGWTKVAVNVQWKEIRALEYQIGGESESRGLYARKSFWRSSCLMPQLKSQETQQVVEAISRRFPAVVLADGAASSTSSRD